MDWRRLRSPGRAAAFRPVVVAALCLSACTTDWHADTFGVGDTPNIVQGTIELAVDESLIERGAEMSCHGLGDYAGFVTGMEVVLTDLHGSVVAEARAGETWYDEQSDPDGPCRSYFVLKDVSYHSDSYTLAVGEPGTAMYEALTLTGDELERDRRHIAIVIR